VRRGDQPTLIVTCVIAYAGAARAQQAGARNRLDPVTVDSKHYKVEFENDAVTIVFTSIGGIIALLRHRYRHGIGIVRGDDEPLAVVLNQHPGHDAVARGRRLPTGHAFGSGHFPVHMNDSNRRAEEANGMTFRAKNTVTKNCTVQMLMDSVDLGAPAHTLAQNVYEVRVGVEEGGMGRHIVPVPAVNSFGNDLIDCS
jgi:hypothetical protein